MIDQIEIASSLTISFSLLLLAIGVVWAPFAALICAKVAPRPQRDPVGTRARTGALLSTLFLFPWVYFLLNILGRRVSDRVVVGAHVVLYLACLLGPIVFNVLLAWEVRDLHVNYPFSDGYAESTIASDRFWSVALFGWPTIFSGGAFFTFDSVVFWVASLLAAATILFYLWARSLGRTARMYLMHFGARNKPGQIDSGDSGLSDFDYTEPFKAAAAILGIWLISLVTFLCIGIAVFDDCILNCTT